MNGRKRFVMMIAAAFVALGVVQAWAFYSASGNGSGDGSVGTLGSPAPVTASASGGLVTVDWAAVPSPNGTNADLTYAVERRPEPGSSWTAAGDACVGALAQDVVSCQETVGSGSYVYRVTANFKLWTSQASSAAVTVSASADVTAPVTVWVTNPSQSIQYRGATMPAFVGFVADDAAGEGLDADSSTFTLRRPDGNYWNGSAWQVAAFNLATTHAGTTNGDAVGWTSAATMPAWASQTDGIYTATATATDRAGNSAAGTTTSFTLDNTNPITASVASPANGVTVNAFPATFSGDFADNAGGVGLLANTGTFTLRRSTDNNYWSGSAWQSSAVALHTSHFPHTTGNTVSAWTNAFALPSGANVVDATYTVQATVADRVGNVFSGAAITFTLDRVNPASASLTTPASGVQYRGASVPATFGGSAADSAGGAGLAANSTTFTLRRSTDNNYWTGSAWQAPVANLATTHAATTSGTAAAWTNASALPAWASQADGTYTVQAKATDKASNALTGTAITFTLENTNPITASVASPVNGSAGTSFPATFTGSAADNAGGLGLNANSATYTLQRSSDDDYWTGSAWQPGAAALATTHGATTGNAATTWTSAAAMPAGANLADDVYTVRATVTDKVGNALSGTASSFTLDRVNPGTASVTAITTPANVWPAIGGSAADNSGGAGLNANGTTFTLQRSTDSRYWSGSGWQTGVANLATTHAATTSNTAATWTSNVTMPAGSNLVDATYTIQAKATDRATNWFQGSAITFVFDDTLPSTASVATPANGGQFRAATVPATFSGSVQDNSGGTGFNANSATYTLRRSSDGNYWDGSEWQVAASDLATTHVATTSNTSVTWTSSAAMPAWASQSDGAYTVQATATDKAGNAFSGTTITFTLDSTAPTASVTSPANGTITNAFPSSFTGSVADNAGGTGVNANTATLTLQRSTDNKYWTGSVWQAGAANLATTHASTTSNTAATWTSNVTMPSAANLVDATYTLQATGTDKVANQAAGSAITFTLERVNPVTATVTAVTTPTSTYPASFTGSAADNLSGVGLGANTVTYTLQRSTDSKFWTGSLWQASAANLATTHAATTSNTAAAWTSAATMPSRGEALDATYTVQAKTTDKAGNTLTGSAITFVLNRTPTTIALETTDNGTAGLIEKGDKFSVTFSDPMKLSTFCSTWTPDTTDKSISTNNDVTVTLGDNNGPGGNDTLTISAAPVCTFKFGTINLGSNGFVTGGNATFSGTGSGKSQIDYTVATRTLLVTLGTKAGAGTPATVGSVTATYTPDAGLQDTTATALTGSVTKVGTIF